MNDVPGDDAVVVCLNPRVDPEGFDPHDLLLLVAHRTRHIHHVKDERIAFGRCLVFHERKTVCLRVLEQCRD